MPVVFHKYGYSSLSAAASGQRFMTAFQKLITTLAISSGLKVSILRTMSRRVWLIERSLTYDESATSSGAFGGRTSPLQGESGRSLSRRATSTAFHDRRTPI